MTERGHLCRPILISLVFLLIGPLSAWAQEDNSFMPKGGKTLLLELLGTPLDAAALREVAEARHTEAEWRDLMAARKKTLSERDLNELAAYLALNLPLPAGALDKATTRGDFTSALPADGRELAWTQCQFCHSLFSGYLMQQRDVQGWRNVFLSPFHRGIKMTPPERETFAGFWAASMPLKKEDVPAELRF